MYKYDVALSFAGEMEREMREIAAYLRSEGNSVFFFPDEQNDMVSRNIYEKTYQIYQKESLVKALFVSEGYCVSKWTNIEKRRSLDSTREEPERLIVVNYIGDRIEDVLGEFIYLDGSKMENDEIAATIAKRIKQVKGDEILKEPHIKTTNIINDHGIVVGDNAVFGNIRID